MTAFYRVASTLTKLALAPAARRFRRDLDQPGTAQERLLRELIARTSVTEYGSSHALARTDDYEAFATKMPIVDYDDLEPWIDAGRLVAEPVLSYELTSGSTAPSKRIPYTRSLRDSFHRMFGLWLYDILTNGPPLETGRFFLRTDDDLQFLRRPMSALVRRFLITDLSAQPEGISIWNPSTLLLVLDEIDRPLESVKLISCWASANARRGADALRAKFPNATLQPKGLLATEAPVTIPLFEASGFVPLLNEVFIELEGDDSRVARLHEAEVGREYALIVSQKGGLLRYRLGDRVRVTHRFRATPCLAFLGRADDVSDLVGEKLSESFVRRVISMIAPEARYGVALPRSGVGPPTPAACGAGAPPRSAAPHYTIVVDRAAAPQELLSRRVEIALTESHRYREARLLGQLAAARVVVVPDVEARVLDYFVHRGMKAGDVKPVALIKDAADAEALAQILEECRAPALQ